VCENTSFKMQVPLEFKTLNLYWKSEQHKRQRVIAFRNKLGFVL
jgi:hypothetical protein